MFLDNLIQRTFGEATTLSPRRTSRFEPASEPSEPLTAAAQPPSTPQLRREPTPAPLQLKAPPAERFETRIVERLTEPRGMQGESFKVVTKESVAAPVPGDVRSPPAEVVAVSERPAGRRATPPVAQAPSPHEPISVVSAEPSRETVMGERVESHVETRTIERRLESLVQERHVEHAEQLNPPVTSRREQPQPVARQVPPTEPRRSVVMPEMKQAAPESPVLMEVATPAAVPVVHVTIGRVEIKAATPTPVRQAPRSREPKLGLEDYLRRREKL